MIYVLDAALKVTQIRKINLVENIALQVHESNKRNIKNQGKVRLTGRRDRDYNPFLSHNIF